jgi:uncharacterized membrane protein
MNGIVEINKNMSSNGIILYFINIFIYHFHSTVVGTAIGKEKRELDPERKLSPQV